MTTSPSLRRKVIGIHKMYHHFLFYTWHQKLWLPYPLDQMPLSISSSSPVNSSHTSMCAERNKRLSWTLATVGVINIWVAHAYVKTCLELVKQTQNNEVNHSTTTSKFPYCMVVAFIHHHTIYATLHRCKKSFHCHTIYVTTCIHHHTIYAVTALSSSFITNHASRLVCRNDPDLKWPPQSIYYMRKMPQTPM